MHPQPSNMPNSRGFKWFDFGPNGRHDVVFQVQIDLQSQGFCSEEAFMNYWDQQAEHGLP
jgi:hypothetical protein